MCTQSPSKSTPGFIPQHTLLHEDNESLEPCLGECCRNVIYTSALIHVLHPACESMED